MVHRKGGSQGRPGRLLASGHPWARWVPMHGLLVYGKVVPAGIDGTEGGCRITSDAVAACLGIGVQGAVSLAVSRCPALLALPSPAAWPRYEPGAAAARPSLQACSTVPSTCGCSVLMAGCSSSRGAPTKRSGPASGTCLWRSTCSRGRASCRRVGRPPQGRKDHGGHAGRSASRVGVAGCGRGTWLGRAGSLGSTVPLLRPRLSAVQHTPPAGPCGTSRHLHAHRRALPGAYQRSWASLCRQVSWRDRWRPRIVVSCMPGTSTMWSWCRASGGAYKVFVSLVWWQTLGAASCAPEALDALCRTTAVHRRCHYVTCAAAGGWGHVPF